MCDFVWRYDLRNLNTDSTNTLFRSFHGSLFCFPLYSVSPLAQFQLQEEDEQGSRVAEQELTSEEVIERLQETVMLVEKLKEANVLERRLREVRDLEDRLQGMDEMAERLQDVIEQELGKEEVDKLREEDGDLEQERQIQAERIVQTVLRKSVSKIETKEDEVDELEEQIKEVFLKGLLPEEEEVEVKQETEKEVTDESVLDDSLREKLRQIEKEWRDDVEDKLKSGSSDVTSSIVAYQKVERRTKKRVTIVEERGRTQEEMEDVQVQRVVMSEERIEKEMTWRKTETLEEITEGEVTERLQTEDRSQGPDEDIWFILFDRPPYKAVFKPPGKVCHCANSFRPLLISLISLPFSSIIHFCVLFFTLTIEQSVESAKPSLDSIER